MPRIRITKLEVIQFQLKTLKRYDSCMSYITSSLRKIIIISYIIHHIVRISLQFNLDQEIIKSVKIAIFTSHFDGPISEPPKFPLSSVNQYHAIIKNISKVGRLR